MVLSILAVTLHPIEQGIDRSFYTIPPEGLPWFISRCVNIVHMQRERDLIIEEELGSSETYACKSR